MKLKALSSTLIGFLLLTIIGVVGASFILPIFNLEKFKPKPKCEIRVVSNSLYSDTNTLVLNLDYKNCNSFYIEIKDVNGKTKCVFEELPNKVISLDLSSCNLNKGEPYFVYINGVNLKRFYYI
jgi:uncharacterized membrane protein